MNVFVRQFHKAVNVTRTFLSLDENTRRWNALRNAYNGQRVFLIGNGPSLNETPLFLLKGELTLCFNRFHLLHERLSWSPYFYMCIDPAVLPDMAAELNEHASQYRYLCVHSQHAGAIIKRNNVLLMHPVARVPYFSRRLPLFASGGTVAYAGLQMLMFAGFTTIYLVGVDQNYVIHRSAVPTHGIRVESQHDDDPNHFDPRYFGKGRTYHQPVEATRVRMRRSFTRARDIAVNRGIVIRNAGIGGQLEVFERVDFLGLFAFSRDEEYQLLAESVSSACRPERLRAYIENGRVKENLSASISDGMFLVESELGKKWIPRLITRYVPFGPIQGRFLFIRREERRALVAQAFE